jgi:DNA repair protein RadC
MVYRGQVGQISIRGAELLKEAIRVNAPSLILSHCHPSGDPTLSTEDVTITGLINEVANLLGIELLDHIVVDKDSWVSLKERGLGFESLKDEAAVDIGI